MEFGLFQKNPDLRKINRNKLNNEGHEVVIEADNAADAWIDITERHRLGKGVDAAFVDFDAGSKEKDEHIAEMIVSVLRERYGKDVKIAVVKSNGHRGAEPPEADVLLDFPDASECLRKLAVLENKQQT
jgi:hypothetical protein